MTTGMIIGRVRVRAPNKVGERIAHGLANGIGPAARKAKLALLDRLHNGCGGILGELVVDGKRDTAARELDGLDLLVLERDDGNGRDHTVVGELLAIAQDNGVGIADTQAVDVDDAGLDGCTALDDTTAHLERVAVIEDKDMIVLDAHLAGELGMSAQMHGLTVNRHKVRGFGHGHQELELLLATVTGDVDESAVLIPHVAAELGQAVDDLLDGLLVAGNGSC